MRECDRHQSLLLSGPSAGDVRTLPMAKTLRRLAPECQDRGRTALIPAQLLDPADCVLSTRLARPGGEDMPIRRGEEYLESLRDGRRVWLMGQRVDVTTHPALAGCARSVAAVYDLQHDVTHHELLTIPSPTTGKPVSRAYLLPRSVDDLAGQRRMYECLVRRAGGVAARLPQHLATVVLGLYDVRDLLGREDPAFADHVV